MDIRTLGTDGPQVSALGLGLMGMSGMYGPADEAESIATVHAALDAGMTLLDTGDFYGMGHNELLLSRALTGRDRDATVISVKFGAQRGPDGSWLGYDARPAAVKTAAAYSLQRLVGARRRDRLTEALGALDLPLSQDDLDAIEAAVPAGSAAGARYAEAQLASLDSERSTSAS
ncbi:aldo/keto reductase [Jatrophihabitans lederbergiae]|uniref:Aldo/keto reductase n=1 Tax=Jatrophihabitans lederbergiae TaxID=3075547 RepID=A0ABU2JF18_9ACTN|nr:aldo/keto reductase [Jatrophihabitans sp. DSM 44399]MDT0263044.1 aldo/keto reductase [Jatrophihabitans sp. DSM 44399]